MNQNPEFSDALCAGVLLLGVFISSVSQVLLKKASQRKYSSKIREYLNTPVIIAYSLFGGATLLSVLAYRGIPLSWGPILESTGYLYVTVFGILIFHEKMNKRRSLGLLLILIGVVIYAIFG